MNLSVEIYTGYKEHFVKEDFNCEINMLRTRNTGTKGLYEVSLDSVKVGASASVCCMEIYSNRVMK